MSDVRATASVSPPTSASTPRWFDVTVIAGAIALTSVTGIGMVLAMAGHFHWWIALGVGGVVTVAAVWTSIRLLTPTSQDGPPCHWWAIAAVAVALFSCGWAWFAPSEHVLIDRDPGSYVATARWLSTHGTLEVENAKSAFAGVPGLTFDSAAVYDMHDGRLQFQFDHGASVAAATAEGALGTWGLWRIGGFVGAWGLLALFAVAVLVTRRPWAGLVVMVGVGASLPYIGISRDLYSEPFVLLLLWAGVLACAIGFLRSSWWFTAVGALMVGATTWFRIDGLLYVAILIALTGLATLVRDTEVRRVRLRQMVVAWIAAAVAVVLSFVDLRRFAGQYATLLRSQYLQLGALCVAAGVVMVALAVAWPRMVTRLRWSDPGRSRVATALGAVVAVVMLAALWVRPLVQTARSVPMWGTLNAVQVAEGHPLDPTRTYAEHSLVWMSWYLGPVLLLSGVIGAGLLTRRFVRGTVGAAGAAVLGLLVVGGGLYWWNPNITADHLWVMRRFVPAAIPALLIAATAAVACAIPLLARWLPSRWPGIVAVVLTVVGLVFVIDATAPVALPTEQRGMESVVKQACTLLGPRAAVIVVGDTERNVLPQSIRSWCNVPVAASVHVKLTPDQLAGFRVAAARSGRLPRLVSFDRSAVRNLPVRIDGSSSPIVPPRRLEHTLTRRPGRYLDSKEDFYLPARLQLVVSSPVPAND
jgi:hypothetical protein